MKLFIADWSVNKKTYEEFQNFLVDIGFDVQVKGFDLVATNGSKVLLMFKGFKCNRNMLAATRRFKEQSQ
ncbi:hypothetical protein ODQ17_17000 [Acinetobacter sp. IRS14]|uniref:hypothetical protein n=1 Tax=Acinetobacter sp. IRS14 TaxID=2983398 RepID=UPI002AFEAE48|nr:hypothetical protein [Acinetobacter sp. IRS14]MEA1231074.1 hypothetical protein [Acinetobacter sp. IRS14]